MADYISALEEALGKTAERQLLPPQPGDVADTFAATGALETAVGYKPSTTVRDGIAAFVGWYRAYYGV